MAGDILAQHRNDGAGHRRHGCRCGWRQGRPAPILQMHRLGRLRAAGRLHDRPRLRPSCLAAYRKRAARGTRPPRARRRLLRRAACPGAPRHRSAVRARVLLPPPVRHRRSRRLGLDVLHHGAAALFQPVRAKPRRTSATRRSTPVPRCCRSAWPCWRWRCWPLPSLRASACAPR